MPDINQTEILRQLAGVRRELRLVRGLLTFVSLVAALFLFAPALALFIAAATARVWALLADDAPPVVGILTAVAIAAVVISRRSNRGRDEARAAKGQTAQPGA